MNGTAGAQWRSLWRSLVGSLAAYAVLAALLPAAASAAGVVPTDNGPVRGVETQAAKKYLGIPYAAPPVGHLRWRAPQAPARWHGPRDASRFGNHCPQTASPFGFESKTEDCLYLNVFTPNRGGRGHAKDLPVMVWFHGGGLTVGESDDYDPTRLVQQGVAVVTVNYRLGYLGFLAHPALSAESGNGGSGNYGLMDQQAALRWVQGNIKKFGGDADNVTIFGQSAGGLSVHAHLASPRSAGLFDRAVVQSGAYAAEIPSLAAAESSGTAIAQDLGCPDQSAACLRSAQVETILAVQPEIAGAIVPNIDGNVLTRSIGSAIDSGQFNRVPVIEGSTHDEFTIFTALYVVPLISDIPLLFYEAVVGVFASTLGLDATGTAIVAEYPLSDYSNGFLALSAIGTDAIFACPSRRAARSLAQFVPTYSYELDDPDVPQIFVPPASFPFGSYHAADVLYLFDSELRGGHAPFTADQEALAGAIVGYWTQFAQTGAPSRPGLPQWPAYTPANDKHMSLEPLAPRAEADFAAEHKCDFWDSHAGGP
jgi:para-nitrobenzyl esterase